MNDKIKEFAGKALDKAVSYTWTQLDYDQIQKLLACHAELIVRECVGVCESMQLIGPYKEVQDATLKDAAIQIKEHFGVEE
jgi:hypothetical protein